MIESKSVGRPKRDALLMQKDHQKVSGLTYRSLALKGEDGGYNANNGVYVDQYQGCLGPSFSNSSAS